MKGPQRKKERKKRNCLTNKNGATEDMKTANNTNRDHSGSPKLVGCATALIIITSSKNNERRNINKYIKNVRLQFP